MDALCGGTPLPYFRENGTPTLLGSKTRQPNSPLSLCNAYKSVRSSLLSSFLTN